MKAAKRRDKDRAWKSLKDEKCPRCGKPFTMNMFDSTIVNCSCDFTLKKETKDIIVKRDHTPQAQVSETMMQKRFTSKE